MAASLSGEFHSQFFTDSGLLAAGYRLYTYAPGTTTKKTAYTDAAGSVAHTYTADGLGGEYIALNARGELPAPLFLNSGGYDITLKTDAGVTVWTRRAAGSSDAAADTDTAVRADLASTADAAKGAALVGYSPALAYASGLGQFLNYLHKRTAAEIAASVTPTNYAYLPGDVRRYGAVGDGTTDDTAAIQSALNAGNLVFLPAGTYKITSALSVTDNRTLYGAGSNATIITTSVNTINAIETTSDARRVNIRDLGITSTAGRGASNAAIKQDLTLGVAQSEFSNLRILNFFYGIRWGDRFWDSTVRNVRCDTCSYGAYSDGLAGTNINVHWDRFYSEEHQVTGFQVAACFTYLLHACNFGGEQGGGQSQAVAVTSNAALRFVSCNFEIHLVAADTGVVSIGSTAKVILEDCTWSANAGAAATGYALDLRDSATAEVRNCKDFAGGANWSQIRIANTATLTKHDDQLATVVHASGSTASTVVHSPYQSRQYRSDIIDLSGAATTKLIYVPKRNGRVTRVAVIYTEASSADAGITITVRSDDSTFTYASFTSHTSQALYDVQEITLASSTIVSSTRPVVVSSPGGKVGTGEISIIFECDED